MAERFFFSRIQLQSVHHSRYLFLLFTFFAAQRKNSENVNPRAWPISHIFRERHFHRLPLLLQPRIQLILNSKNHFAQKPLSTNRK